MTFRLCNAPNSSEGHSSLALRAILGGIQTDCDGYVDSETYYRCASYSVRSCDLFTSLARSCVMILWVVRVTKHCDRWIVAYWKMAQVYAELTAVLSGMEPDFDANVASKTYNSSQSPYCNCSGISTYSTLSHLVLRVAVDSVACFARNTGYPIRCCEWNGARRTAASSESPPLLVIVLPFLLIRLRRILSWVQRRPA